MGKKEKNQNRSFSNDLDLNSEDDHDPEINLDEYINLQNRQQNSLTSEPVFDEKERSQFKNAVLIFIVFAAALLWFNNWSVTNTWASFFGNNEASTEVRSAAPLPAPSAVQMPEVPPIPGNTGIPVSSLNMSITDYLSALRDKGYLGNQISSFSARQLFDANIPVSHLDELQNAGLLEGLSFVYITNYYQNQIPISFISQLKEAGIYDKLSFVDVTQYYTNNVPINYLLSLNKAGYLEDLSFVNVTNFYKAGVTVEYLNELKEKGLYEDLTFLDIIDLYQRENGN